MSFEDRVKESLERNAAPVPSADPLSGAMRRLERSRTRRAVLAVAGLTVAILVIGGSAIAILGGNTPEDVFFGPIIPSPSGSPNPAMSAGAIMEVRFATPSRVMARAEGGLYESYNGGRSWRFIEGPSDAFTLRAGELIAAKGDGSSGVVTLTRHFQFRGPCPAKPPCDVSTQRVITDTPKGGIYQGFSIAFTGESLGWMLAGLDAGPDVSDAQLFATTDGGLRWIQLARSPFGDLMFLDDKVGFIAGGPGSHHLYRTSDGGKTWTEVTPPLPRGCTGEPRYVLPRFFDKSYGLVSVAIQCDGEDFDTVPVYETSDTGRTWKLKTTVEPREHQFTTQFAAPTRKDWFFANGRTLFASHDGGRTTQVVDGQTPALVSSFGAVDARTLWIIGTSGRCTSKSCLDLPALWISLDGGENWALIRIA